MNLIVFRVLFLMCFSAAAWASPLEDFIKLGLELSKSSDYQKWEAQADFSLFSQSEELSRAFVEGLAENPSEEALRSLAELLGENEASSIKAMESIFDQLEKDPRFLNKLEAKLDWLTSRIQRGRPEAMAFSTRLYEIGLLSASYIGLVYSLQGYNPTLVGYGDAFISSPIPIFVLLVVAFRREAMAMKIGLPSYLRQWRNHHRSLRFIKNLRQNLELLRNFGVVTDLAVSYEVSKSIVIDKRGQKLAEAMVSELEENLEKIRAKGLLSQFVSFLNSRKMRGLREKVLKDRTLARSSFAEPIRRKGIHLNPNPLSIYDYLEYRSHIAAWLASHPEFGISDLSQVAQAELRSLDAEAVRFTKMRSLDKLAIESLTIGSLAIGLALAVGSASDFAYFDSLISDRLVEFIRTERMLVGTSVLFVPGFTLLYIEGSTIFASAMNRLHRRKYQATEMLRSRYDNILRTLRLIQTESDLYTMDRIQDSYMTALDLLNALAKGEEIRMVRSCRKLF